MSAIEVKRQQVVHKQVCIETMVDRATDGARTETDRASSDDKPRTRLTTTITLLIGSWDGAIDGIHSFRLVSTSLSRRSDDVVEEKLSDNESDHFLTACERFRMNVHTCLCRWKCLLSSDDTMSLFIVDAAMYDIHSFRFVVVSPSRRVDVKRTRPMTSCCRSSMTIESTTFIRFVS